MTKPSPAAALRREWNRLCGDIRLRSGLVVLAGLTVIILLIQVRV